MNSKLRVDQKLMSFDRFKSPLLIASFVLASLLMPMFQLVNNNIDDLGIQYIDGVLISILISLIVFAFSSIVAWGPFQRFLFLLSLSLVIASFMNTFFVPNNLLVSDGTDDILFYTRSEAGYVVFFTFILLIFPLYFKGKAFLKINEILLFLPKLLVVLAVLLTSYQVAFLPEKQSFLLKLFSTDKTKKLLTLGKKNVLILSFDQVQGSAFNGFINSEDGEAFKNILSGFDFYPNAVSTYPNTEYSLSGFFLTRPVNNNSETMRSSINSEGNFLRKASVDGIKSEIYYPAKRLDLNADFTHSKTNPILLCLYALNNAFGLNLTKYRILKDLNDNFSKHSWKLDAWLLEKLPNHIIYDETLPGNIVFMHFLFSHQPFMLHDSGWLYNQKTLGQKQNISGFIDSVNFISTRTSSVIQKLREIGVYDNTAIFLMSDHGFEANINSRKALRENPHYFHANDDFISKDNIKSLGAYNPTLLFKDFDSQHSFRVKDNVISLNDIGATVCDLMQCGTLNKSDTISLRRLENAQKRLHDFWIYHGGAAERHSGGYDRYHTFDSKYWSRYKASSLDELRKVLISEMATTMVSNDVFSFSRDYVMNIGLSDKESWGQWSDGTEAEIMFKTEPNSKNRSIQFNLKAFVTPKNPEQTASVFINAKSVGNIQISADNAQPKQFTFPLPASQDNMYTIRFEINKPTAPKSLGIGEDIRELGIGFIDMKLLQDEVTT